MAGNDVIIRAHDSVRDALAYLCGSKVKSFYARVINALEKVPVPGIRTMGVTQIRGRYVLMYDPEFATRVNHEELLATLEHECLHIILGHLPRYLQLRSIYGSQFDKKMFDMTSNIAADLADNQLLKKDYPKILDVENKPLGYWVLPGEFNPPLPEEMDYESYHKLVLAIVNNRLQTPPNKLWEMAQQILKEQGDKIRQALQKAKQQQQQTGSQGQEGEDSGSSPPKEGEGKGEKPQAGAGKDGEGQQQGQQQGQSPDGGQQQGGSDGSGGASQQSSQQQPGGGQGQGQSQGQGQQGDSHNNDVGGKSLEQQIEELDPIDQKILEMLVHSTQSHIGWEASAEGSDPSDSHKLKNHGKDIIKSTLTSHQKSRGTVPSHLMELIRKMLLPPVVPWTELLNQIVQNTRQKKPKRGMRRVNKKLAAMQIWLRNKEKEGLLPPGIKPGLAKKLSVFPGTSWDKKFTILYCLDTSGSMSVKELQRGLSELQHIQKSDPDITVIVLYIDAGIGKEYVIGPNDEIDPQLTGRGGTDFEPGFLRAKELLRSTDKAPDILIYATDGYCPAPRTRLPIPTVWLITPGGNVVTKDAGHITLEMKDKHLGESSEYDEVA